MLHKQIIRDAFGTKYKLHFPSDGPIPKQVKPKSFHDEISTRNFLYNMDVSESYWRQLSFKLVGSLPYSAGSTDYLDIIAHSLILGRVQLFKIDEFGAKKHAIEKRTFRQPDGNVYQFVPPVERLISPNKYTKKFTSKTEAVAFVKILDVKEKELSDLACAFDLDIPGDSILKGKSEALLEPIGSAVMEERILIFVEKSKNTTTPETIYENIDLNPVPLGPETEEALIEVTAKIDAAYKVILFDKQLSKHQDQNEGKIQTDATVVELWLDQSSMSPVFDQGAKIDLGGTGKIQAFLNQDLTTELDLSQTIPADKVTGGNKLKVWLRGTATGKVSIKLTPSASSNGKFVIKPPAELEMGVVELKLEVYEQDSLEIAKIQKDPDQEPISKYHTDLESINLPQQIVLSDQDKVKRGRVLHVQENGNFGRSKIVIKSLAEDQFPAGCDDYQITIDSGGKSGSLKLFDAEFDGNEVPLPLSIVKTDFTADKIYWAEGISESHASKETRLHMGFGGGPSLQNGDWASFTIVKISEISLDVLTTAGKAEVWNKAKKRFYVNLDGTDEARKLKDKPGHRDVKVRATLSKKIPGIVIHFCLVPDKRNWDNSNWGANLLNFELSKVERDLKQVDKIDHKDLVHLTAKTDADGNADIQSLMLSRIGGDIFTLGAYLDQDPHISKYVDGHTSLSKRKPVLSKDSIEIWRKFYIQNTFNKNILLPSRALTEALFEKCFIEIDEIDEQKYDPVSIGGLVEHELWQFDSSGSTRKVVCVGDVNKAKFTGLFKAPTDATKPKAHMVMCDVQWDSKMGVPQDFLFSSRITAINYTNSAGNSYLGVFDPPLGGGSIVQPSSKWLWDDGSNKHMGVLNDTHVAIEKSRGHYSEVKVSIPSVCPASCPCGSPGTPIVPVVGNEAIVRVKLKGATGPWAGESGSPGNPQCLIVVNSNVNQFNNTIAHEIGHLFKAVRKATNWKGIPDHPNQYIDRGGQGSHCKESATEHATRVDQNGDKIYVGGTCVMYHVAVGNTVFCDDCSVDMRVRDVSDIFKD